MTHRKDNPAHRTTVLQPMEPDPPLDITLPEEPAPMSKKPIRSQASKRSPTKGHIGPKKGTLAPIEERPYRSEATVFVVAGDLVGGWMGTAMLALMHNGRKEYTVPQLAKVLSALNAKKALKTVKLSRWKTGAIGAARHATRELLRRGIVKVKSKG